MKPLLLALALAGCGSAPDLLGETADVRIETWVEGDPGAGPAELVVQVDAEAGVPLDLPEPEVTGLRFSEVGSPVMERIGDRNVTTRRFRFNGEPGSYEIPAFSVPVEDTDALSVVPSEPVWVDVGQATPDLQGFVEVEEPPKVFRLTTAMIVGAACAGLIAVGAAGGVGLTFWGLGRGGRARELPPESPDVRALRQWEAVRSDPDLDDHAKAVAIATIFREYVEAVLGFPATAWTTSEILRRLEGMVHLPDGNVGRARRILRATDRIKFADDGARNTLFEELDDALRTFVGSTRPTTWKGDP